MRKKTGAVMAMCIAASLVGAMHPAAASAQVSEKAATASVTGPAVDSWDVAGGALNLLIGSTTCTLSADTPFRSANQVKGHGAVNCSRTWDLLTLQVCVQVKQAAADDGGATWQPAACQPLKQARNSSSLQDTATAQCVPNAAAYRTFTEAKGFRQDDHTNPAFDGIITSGQAVFDCAI